MPAMAMVCVPSSGVSIMFAFIWSPFSPFTPSCVFPSSVLQPVLPNLVFLTRGCPIAPPLAPFPFPSCESSVHSALFILLLIPYPIPAFSLLVPFWFWRCTLVLCQLMPSHFAISFFPWWISLPFFLLHPLFPSSSLSFLVLSD